MVDFTQAAQTIGVSTGQQSGTVIESLNPEELVADGAIHHSIDLRVEYIKINYIATVCSHRGLTSW
jgi:hypothetical protein